MSGEPSRTGAPLVVSVTPPVSSLWPARLRNLVLSPTRCIVLQIPRALVVAAVAAAVDVGVLAALVEGLGVAPWIAACVGYFTGGLVQYAASETWVFGGHIDRRWGTLSRFLSFQLLSVGGLAVTWAVMAVGNEWLGIHYLVAKGAALCLAFFYNYLSRRWWVYRERGRGLGAEEGGEPR